jgi:hypothetical protein
MSDVNFSEPLRAAIRTVYGQIEPDLEASDAEDMDIVAEIVIDANRLTLLGFEAEDEELHEWIDKMGYEAVHEATKKAICMM